MQIELSPVVIKDADPAAHFLLLKNPPINSEITDPEITDSLFCFRNFNNFLKARILVFILNYLHDNDIAFEVLEAREDGNGGFIIALDNEKQTEEPTLTNCYSFFFSTEEDFQTAQELVVVYSEIQDYFFCQSCNNSEEENTTENTEQPTE